MRRSEITLIVAFVALAVAALWTGRYAADGLETSAAERAAASLLAIGYPDIEVSADGMVVEVSGRVASVEDRARVMAALEGAPGLSEVVDNLILVAPLIDLRPAELKLTKDARVFTLGGEAPNPEARDLLAARARRANPDHEIVNALQAQDRRASDAWLTAAEAAIDALSALTSGEASAERGVARVSGAAENAARRDEIERRLAAAMGPTAAITADISAPPPFISPYVFEAQKRDGVIALLVCAAPDAAQRDEILGALAATGQIRATVGLGGAGALGAARCPIAEGAPDGNWSAAVSRAVAALATFAEGEARIVDDGVSFIGYVEDGRDLSAAEIRTRAQWPSGYGLDVEVAEVLPTVRPFSLTARKRPGGARLSGHAPSRAWAEAWATRLDATNELALARGAPTGWAEAADAAISALADLSVGSVTLTDRRFLIAADGDAPARARLRERLRAALPANYALEVIAEETPSFPVAGAGAAIGDAARRAAAAGRYGFTATRSADGAARVVGLVADEASRAQVGAYARSRLRGLEFEADLSIGTDAAPPGWERALFAGLEAMSSLTEGELAVDPKAIYLQGRVTRGAAAAAAVLPLEKTPEGYLTFSRVTVVETPPDLGALREEDRLDAGACVAELNRWLEESPIGFEPGSFVIDLAQDAETDTLDRVAAILRRCPEARFEVGGHTDSEGDAEGNRLLSRRRATAVRLSLVARGIAKIRLTSAGYGADTPIADNSTPQGRERNRRIEFRLLDPT